VRSKCSKLESQKRERKVSMKSIDRNEYDKIRIQIEEKSRCLVSKLIEKELFISTAESCTGGMIASAIVDVPDASKCFKESIVTYSNAAKMKYLEVSNVTIAKYGVVSGETVKEMALGMIKQSGSDIAVVTSGIAGPAGGTKEKPVGLVYIACAYKEKILVSNRVYSNMDRRQVRLSATLSAINLCLNILDI
jgi:PncC family amidohydrolase